MTGTPALDVAVFQIDAARPMSARLDALDAALTGADTQSLDLVVCPELFSTGYGLDPAEIRAVAEAVDGPYLQAVAEIARRRGVAIHVGFAERHCDAYYNASVTVDAAGAVLAHYRKRLLPPGYEASVFTSGNGGAGFDLGGLLVQSLVCYEVEFPECVRAAAMGGAAVLLVPTALRDIWPFVAEKMVPVRAFENGVYIVYANYAGSDGTFDYLGGSRIVAPDGSLLAEAGAEEALIRARLDRARIDSARTTLPYLADVDRFGL